MVFYFRKVIRYSVLTAAKSSICWLFIVLWMLTDVYAFS